MSAACTLSLELDTVGFGMRRTDVLTVSLTLAVQCFRQIAHTPY
jgi:hypothetical protein